MAKKEKSPARAPSYTIASDGRRVVKLTHVLTREDGSQLGEIKLRDPDSMTLGDLLAVERDMRAPTDLERATATVIRLSGLDRDEVEQLRGADVQRVFEAVGSSDPKEPEPTPSS